GDRDIASGAGEFQRDDAADAARSAENQRRPFGEKSLASHVALRFLDLALRSHSWDAIAHCAIDKFKSDEYRNNIT
ncbi:MAG: hypothetical protein JSS05_13785, partial [Proteobacteria bacterium]|nr:hypothetical protein [Pseudomonadota bacterium]